MAAENAKTSALGSWIKAGFTSLFGLVSGAVLMYVTPLLNSAIKPPEPLANFGYQAKGLTVTFQNRSTNATDGWWDFGDGTALEPYSPKQATITHTYPKAANYTAKLSLTNLFNEKNERAVTLSLDSSNAPQPVIEDFQVTPLTPSMATPAVFHLVAKAKNADLLVWYCGESRPIELSTDVAGVQERWVTINDPGYHTFRLVAASGKQTVEKALSPQFVGMPENGSAPMATVTVTYDAMQVDRSEKVKQVRLQWQHECRESICSVSGTHVVPIGYQVVKAELDGNPRDAMLRGVPNVVVSPDRTKVVVTADMIRPSMPTLLAPTHTVAVRITMEKRSAQVAKSLEFPASLKVPGRTAIPIPTIGGNWTARARQVALDVKEGPRKIWSGTGMPTNQPVQLLGHPVFVSATVTNNQVIVDVTDPRAGLPPLGN